MNKDTRYSRFEDVTGLYGRLRKEDVEELEAAGTYPFKALHDGYLLSKPCLTVIDPKTGVPSVMLGIVKQDGPLDLIWLLGTDAIETNAIPFAKQSKPILEYLFKETGSNGFYNYSWIGNQLHHKWLKWLGFKAIRKVNMGPHGEEFYEFVKLRSNSGT